MAEVAPNDISDVTIFLRTLVVAAGIGSIVGTIICAVVAVVHGDAAAASQHPQVVRVVRERPGGRHRVR